MERSTLERKRTRRWVWVAVILVVLVAAAGTTWKLWPRQIHVQAYTVTRRDMQNQIFASGTVGPTARQVVMPGTVPGPIEKINVSVGDTVHKGQTLITCVSTAQQAALGQAESQAANAETAYQDALKAYQSAPSAAQAYLKSSLDTAQNALDSANSAVVAARAAVAAQTVRAQISGKVILVNADALSSNGQTSPYVEVVSNDKQIQTNVSEVDAVQLKSGMTAVLSSDAFQNKQWKAKVTRVAEYAQTSSDGTGQVEVDIGHLPKGFPVPLGYQVNIHITSQTHKQVPAVPYSALVQSGTSYAVFVIEGNHVKRTTVSLGITSNTYVEVTKGLKAGTKVVESPPANLQDGEAVVVS